MSQSRDRYEPDDELYQREASVHIERLDDNAFYAGVTGSDGTYYWMRFHSESPITWTVEKYEPKWCRMETVTGPGCQKCRGQWAATLDGLPPSRFIACPDCGNKRCPKTDWHGYKCTGSNKPGQKGDPE